MNNMYELANFFDPSFAEKLYGVVVSNWQNGRSTFKSYPFDPNLDQTEDGYRDIHENHEKIKQSKDFALTDFKKTGGFSRSYHVVDKCETMLQAEEIIQSPDTVKRIEKISGYTDLSVYTTNFYLYDQGCYISQHLDNTEPNLLLTTILYLNKNWQNSYGGLYLYNLKDLKNVSIYTPKFNTMLITNINNTDHLHAVSRVTADIPRVTITCSWTNS